MRRLYLSSCMAILLVFSSLAMFQPANSLATNQLQWIKQDGSKVFSNLMPYMHAKENDKKVPVIITLSDRKEALTLQKNMPKLTIKKSYRTLPMVAAYVNISEIEALVNMKQVKQIEYDSTVKAHMYKSTIWFGSHEVNKENKLNIDGDMDGDSTSYSKEDATIAIVDTGIDPNHVNLDGGKVVGWYDGINGRSQPYDDQGHGTHVAGIAAGEGSREQYKGAAPGASLVGVKVLNSIGSGTFSGVLAGIDWVIANKEVYGIDVLNMSLGAGGSSDGNDALSQAVNQVAAAGIVPVVSAGNGGPNERTISTPAAAQDAITVGALADPSRGGFALASFSSRGPTADGRVKPDISGPGVNIIAPRANSGDQYIAYSGTSMASPYVAGSVALMIAANPNLTYSEIKSILVETAHDMGPRGVDYYYGIGKINTYGAVQIAKNGQITEGLFTPNLKYGEEDLPSSNISDTWQIDTQKLENGVPISVSLTIPNWSFAKDFDLYLYDADNKLVSSSTGNSPFKHIYYQPTTKGIYTIQIKATSGTGDYFIDVSAYTAPFSLIADDQ
ncbi:S8 family peptidase [Hazenella sp. IB182353]|uniref:S8 family peptidase n=1 Tax=Polycladospora coralii TaxID=2771432 RepID=UPI00174711EB|nr:S8 family peptidase [Polycladospora coralii]MBS7529592.1 S8 family peptidase [Polycladospora coralii]